MRLIVKANDDEDILDFLADLEDRTPIRTLGKVIKKNKKGHYFIIDKHKKEGMTTVLLYNAPLDINENGNTLMLFVHNDLSVIHGYLKRLIEVYDYNDKEKRKTVRQLLYIIDYYLQHSEELEKPQISVAEK